MRPVQIHSLSNEHNIPDASTHRNQWIQRFSAGEPLPVPLVRVYLCGALSIEVLCDLQTAPDGTLTPIYNSPEEAPAFSTGERHGVRKRPKSVSTARNLLKLLVSQPGRFAAKDWLIEQLRRPQREEEDEDLIGSGGLARFDNVVALLRGLLCPVGIGETESLRKRLVKLVTTTPRSGDGYRLAPYPLIWVDVDALTTHAQRACALEAEGHDALHEWQAAYTLGMRGPVLQEEVYSDWAQIWREEIEGYLWQSVQALWRHALSRGQQGEAEALRLLRAYWLQHVENEDALRPLLELLGKCGDFQRAEKYYLKLRRMLKEEGRKPDLRTQKTMAEVRACQEPQTHPSVSPVTERPDTTLALPQPSDQRVPSASPRLQGILTTSLLSSLMAGLPDDASLDLPLGVWLAQGAAHFGPLLDQGWSLDHVLETLRILAPIVNAVPVFSQQALRRAMTSSSPHTQRKPITEEERMQLCQMLGESIIAGWKYFISGGNAQVLALGQALLFLVQQTHGLLYPVVRPYCYSGAYGLIGVALHFQERDAEALQAHQSAHIAALATGDPWYVVQSLICQSDCHHALGQYHQALHFIEEALRILGDPLGSAQVCAKAHLLACYADHAMMLADHTTAQEKLEASAIYLDHIVPNEEFDRASWLLLAGKHALLTRAYPTALRSFEDALTQLPAQWTVRRAMTAIGLTKAYARIKEREESLATAENLIPMLETINAHMINRWFAECLQKDLLETFAHDRRVQAFVKDTYQRLPHLPSMTR